MKLKTWRESGNYFDYRGFPIFYRQSKASDEVTLCLHGFPTSSHDYHKIHDALAEQFAVLSFDMIGYGFSAKPVKFDYTTFNQADLLQSLLEYLKVRKVHILAHDYGNTITQELLARIGRCVSGNNAPFKKQTVSIEKFKRLSSARASNSCVIVLP